MYLGPKIFGVHYALFSAFDLETNRKTPDVCYFLIIWFVKLDYVAKALHHTYSCAPEVTFNLLQYFTIYVECHGTERCERGRKGVKNDEIGITQRVNGT